MINMSYLDRHRNQWVVRYENHGRRCDVRVRLVDGFVLEHELEAARAECVRALQQDQLERVGL